MHPLALAASLALHAGVLIWLVIALPDFGERLESGDVTTIEVVMAEADTPPQPPAEAAPLPERAATRTPEPSPPAAAPTPEPAGEPTPRTAETPAESETAAAPPPEPEPEPEPEPTAPEPEPAETAEARPEPAPSPPAETPRPEPVVEAPPAPEPVAPEPTPQDEPAPQAEPAPEMAALAEPPRRRPPRPEPEPATAAPEPAPARSDARPAETAADTPADTPDGAAQPDPDTRREENEEADPVDALLQSVEELARRVEAEEAREGTGDADVDSPTGRLAELRAQRLGRLIYEQIVGCWNPPAGLDGLREVGPVEIRAEFRQNGEVVSAEVADEDRLATDRAFRSVAESARRAVFNCAPLQGMPSEFYQQWRVVILEFRPDQIAAGG